MKILLVGLSYKTTPIEIREKLSFTTEMLRSALTHFDATHSQAHLEDVREGVILSTCNRLEVYAVVRDPAVAQQAIIQFLSRSCDLPMEMLTDDFFYTYQDETAVTHLFRVASGLDSMVLGEPQILGQITDAYELAQSQRAVGVVLSALMRAAIHTGKRARTETAIGVNPSSVSSVAASMADELLGDLRDKHALLVGVGEMGKIVAGALFQRGIAEIVVTNRTYEKAAELAEKWHGRAIGFQQLPDALRSADIVITATGAPHTILNRRLIEPAMCHRPDRPLFIIDIALPRDVDPDVVDISRVYLSDIDALQGQAEDNTQERKLEIPAVEEIVAEEVDQFLNWFSSLEVVPTITDWRKQIETVRRQELERLFNRLDLDERAQKLISTMSHRLISKLLHEPTIRLKEEAAHGNGAVYTSAVRYLFGLDK